MQVSNTLPVFIPDYIFRRIDLPHRYTRISFETGAPMRLMPRSYCKQIKKDNGYITDVQTQMERFHLSGIFASTLEIPASIKIPFVIVAFLVSKLPLC